MTSLLLNLLREAFARKPSVEEIFERRDWQTPDLDEWLAQAPHHVEAEPKPTSVYVATDADLDAWLAGNANDSSCFICRGNHDEYSCPTQPPSKSPRVYYGSEADLDAMIADLAGGPDTPEEKPVTTTHFELEKIIERTFSEIIKLNNTKGLEYANPDDALANFRRRAADLGITPEQVWGIFAGKHFDAIMAYCRAGAVKSEPIEGRLDDLILYSILLKALIAERLGD